MNLRALLFPYLWFNVNHVFYRRSTHQNVFFIPGMFFAFKAGQRNVWLWKVEDACNWPCWPHWVKLFGRSVSPRWGDFAVIGGLEHPRICSIPKYRRFPGFPPRKAPSPTIRHLSKKQERRSTGSSNNALGCIFWSAIPNGIARPCIYSSSWMAVLNVSVENATCTLTRNEVRRKVECYGRSGRFKMRLRFPTADNDCYGSTHYCSCRLNALSVRPVRMYPCVYPFVSVCISRALWLSSVG